MGVTKKPEAKDTVKLVKKLIKQHEQQVVEHKYYDLADTLASLSSTATILDVSAVPQGDTDRTRDGDRISPISISLHYYINGETYSGIVRVMMFRWLPNSVTDTPGASELFHAPSQIIISPFVHDQRGQFNVLYDKTHVVCNNGGSEISVVNKTVKLARKQIDYSNSGVEGSCKLYLLFVTDRVLATSPYGYVRTRLNYTDQ